jgi:hypothetical protein
MMLQERNDATTCTAITADDSQGKQVTLHTAEESVQGWRQQICEHGAEETVLSAGAAVL